MCVFLPCDMQSVLRPFVLKAVRKSLTQVSFDGGLCRRRDCVSGLFQWNTGNWLLRGPRPIQLDS